MSLDNAMKGELKALLKEKIKKKLDTYDFSKKSGNPFVDTLFGDFSNVKSFIHSTATSLGSFYEKIAVKIAEANPNFTEAKKKVLSGRISPKEKAVITDIVKELEETGNGSNYDDEIEEIYKADASSLKKTRITIDLYLKDRNGKEYFIEMKGPDPNKKEVRAAKEDLLNVVAIKKREISAEKFNKKVGITLGIYYNNKKGAYDNWKVSPIFEKGKGLLVQEEFWDFLGGTGTYNDLLGILTDAEKELRPLIRKKLPPV